MSFDWRIFWSNYFPNGLIADVRATIVGALVGWIIGIVTVAASFPDPIEHFVQTSIDGYAQPLGAMVRQIELYNADTTINFDPPDVRDVFVCESAYLTGASYRDIFLKYVDRYSLCLDINQVNKDSFTVRPNRLSGAMSMINEEWHCKCQSMDMKH
jgi:hypothetical protein